VYPGNSVLAAVSGGVDSMALLHGLHQLAPRHGWRLMVAHFNHQLRGAESEADEALVRQTAEQLGRPCFVGRADVKAFAREHKLSIEMAARQLRHEFLARTAREQDCHNVALAHHADDQAELFFLRLLRGAGPEGLAGMEWENLSPANASVHLIRPLLGCLKSELRQYVREQGVAYREDASNQCLDFLRNRIRHKLLPLLTRDYQPALAQNLIRVMDLIGAEADCVGEALDAWANSARPKPFARLPLALQRRCIQAQLFELDITPTYDLIEQLRLTDKPCSVSPSLAIARDKKGWVYRVSTTSAAFSPSELRLELSRPRGTVVFDHVAIDWSFRGQAGAARLSPKPGVEYFDAAKVGGAVCLRHWRPGDRFQPIGLSGSAKLQDLFCNLKIPRARRHELMVAAAADGRLFWVEGLRIAAPFKVEPATTRVLRWRWKREEPEGLEP
jgi:tRNA(Ile)-lysidine synthase